MFYSIYLIFDAMMIVKNKKSLGGFPIDIEDYIVASLMLYIDIVMIFVFYFETFWRRKKLIEKIKVDFN